jgi:hypothetical protein
MNAMLSLMFVMLKKRPTLTTISEPIRFQIPPESIKPEVHNYPPDPFDFVETGEMVEKEPKPKKQTNIDWLCDNPEELAKSLFCPFDICKHDGEPHITEVDICYQCLLDWLKEEHTDETN